MRDSWFAGFGRHRLTVVWLGGDDNKPAGLSGASGALRVWTDVMADVGVQEIIATQGPEPTRIAAAEPTPRSELAARDCDAISSWIQRVFGVGCEPDAKLGAARSEPRFGDEEDVEGGQ